MVAKEAAVTKMRMLELKIRLDERSQKTTSVTAGNEINRSVQSLIRWRSYACLMRGAMIYTLTCSASRAS